MGRITPVTSLRAGIASVAGAGTVGALASGNVILYDDFSSYALTSTTTATRTQLVSGGPYYSLEADGGGPSKIEPWPLDGSLKCFSMEYVADEGTEKLYYLLPPNTTRVKAEWDELRSSTFDYSFTKDVRFPCYRASNGSDSIDVDVYSGFNSETPGAGVDDCSVTGINLQGPNIAPGNDYFASGSFVMQRGEAYHVVYEIKLNTPGVADGFGKLTLTRLSNGQTTTIERLNAKYSKDGVEQCVIRRIQWGMAATTGGRGFAGVSRIYRRNYKITLP